MVSSARSGLTMLGLVALLAGMAGPSGVSCVSCEPQPEPEFESHSVLYDYFGGEQLDQGTWVVHGDGVSVHDGRLRISSSEPWEAGVESREHFFRPRDYDALDISGRVIFRSDTLSSTSIVHVQDHWRPDDQDCYFMEFARNRESTGDNEAFFGVRVDGAIVERVSLGPFDNGSGATWRFYFTHSYCLASFDEAEHVTYAKVYDLGLSLHGSGSATYWDWAVVTLKEKL